MTNQLTTQPKITWLDLVRTYLNITDNRVDEILENMPPDTTLIDAVRYIEKLEKGPSKEVTP